MSDHTKEPWSVVEESGPYGDDYSIYYAKDSCLLDGVTEEDAKRIVQCVNAMAGIADPESFVKMTKIICEWADESGLRSAERVLALFPKEEIK